MNNTMKKLAKYLEKYNTKKYLDLITYGAVLLVGLFLDRSLAEISALLAVTWVIINSVNSETMAKISIGFLLLAAVTIVFGRYQKSGEFVTCAYLSIILTIVLLIYEKVFTNKVKA
ncbi:MAG: hypothetical protein WCI57_03170 [Candidatus Berkelbacteria bacterium]